MVAGDAVLAERFDPAARAAWDTFVSSARNGVFLFQRDYMDYHADRFHDHSLLFRRAGEVVALLPANQDGDALVSHGGLTFGGIVSSRRMTAALMLDVFAALLAYMRSRGIPRLLYKAVPHIYHEVPAEEDLYALTHAGARLYRRDLSSTIALAHRLPLAKGRRSALNVARRNGVTVQRSADFHAFMTLEAEQLAQRHGVRPVHTGDEMALLAGRFPENIHLYTAEQAGELVGGVIVYESSRVAHAQYIATSERGRSASALDLIMDHLLNEQFAEKQWFDFGISTVDQGRTLNAGLCAHKEAFGARAIVHDFYELDVTV